MKLGAIFRFEFAYQARRIAPWLYAAALLFVGWSVIQGNYVDDARGGWLLLNAPLVIASTMVIGGGLWLFVAASIAGDAAARDVESGMHPLAYTAPVSRRDYLAGRFLAAFALNATLLLAVPAGIVLGMHWPAVPAELFGPTRPLAYVLAFAIITLPNAFVATAVQFAFAALGRRAILAYFGSVVLFFASMGLAAFVGGALREQDLARLLDPVGMIAVVSHLSDTWTPTEVSTKLVGLQPRLLANRALWLAVGAAVLALTYARFRVARPAEGRRTRRRKARTQAQQVAVAAATTTAVRAPAAPARRFGVATQLHQLLAVALRSLRTLAKGWTVFAPLAAVAVLVCITVPARMDHLGVPLLPRTEYVLTFLTAALADPGNRVWMLLPLLIVFYAGELVWGERDARMGEIAGAAPVPEWVSFGGRFLALAALLLAWMLALGGAGMVAQAVLGHTRFEVGLYAQVLLGLQWPDYLLFAALALALHTVANQKHLGTLAALAAYALIAFAPLLGIEHKRLVFAASPDWSYSDIRGFAGSIAPWLAFKAYWAAWALVLAVVARLAWVRGREADLRSRLRLARARFTRPTAFAAAFAAVAVLGLGGLVFHNTNVLNHYRSQDARVADQAAYERLYSRYADAAQPTVVASSLQVELYPERSAADFAGTYRLRNHSTEAIARVHVATATGDGVDTRRLRFDRPARRVLDDVALGHRIYELATPLAPGDTLQLEFDVRFAPQGFANTGADDRIVGNGSWVLASALLPAIGYQPVRELRAAGDRAAHGLPARPLLPPLADAAARRADPGDVGMEFQAVVGTAAGQVAIAPGTLRRQWRDRGRDYFHYASDAPIRDSVQFFSAHYAVDRRDCAGVAVEVFHHPTHAGVVDTMGRSACASLARYGALYGPYPQRTLRLVENPVRDIGAHSEPGLIDYGDGFALLDPAREPDGLDLVYAVTAHEIAHQWWGGGRFVPARVEGAGVLIESMATYSATQVMDAALGPAQKQAYLDMMRREYQVPRSLAAPPLLRADEQFLYYRKGPLALVALSRTLGADAVTDALRRLRAAHPPGRTPRPTTLDLYRELQASTPARHRTLLHDLFAANTYWELAATQATKRKLADGRWRVRIDVGARKLIVDAAGAEHDQPLAEWVEVGVYAGPPRLRENGDVIVGAALHLRRYRVDAATRTIDVTVDAEPGHVGVDPRALLVDVRPRDNFAEIAAAP